jgi:hypothetical protein
MTESPAWTGWRFSASPFADLKFQREERILNGHHTTDLGSILSNVSWAE